MLGGGDVHASRMAQELCDGLSGEDLLAGKGYDSRSPVAAAAAAAAGRGVLIRSRSNSLNPRTYDPVVDRERDRIERLLNGLKNCRRAATRYEQAARNFLAMIQLAGTMLWLA